MIVSFEQMLEKAKQGEPMVLAGAAAQDVDTIKAMAAAEEAGMIRPVLVGDIPTIERVMKEEGVTFRNAELVQADDMVEACAKAVELVRLGKADFLMKGLVDTNIFLKAILNKETGLPVHGLLSHVMTFDTLGAYHKLMLTSDGGMVLYPTLEQKIGLIKNCLPVAKALEIENPKVAVLCAKEKVNPKMPATVDAAELKKLVNSAPMSWWKAPSPWIWRFLPTAPRSRASSPRSPVMPISSSFPILKPATSWVRPWAISWAPRPPASSSVPILPLSCAAVPITMRPSCAPSRWAA